MGTAWQTAIWTVTARGSSIARGIHHLFTTVLETPSQETAAVMGKSK